MTKYLYGASVQGIQSFIFETNKLKEIVGASELVEEICTSVFAELLNKKKKDLYDDANAITNAAGNIKYLFEDKTSCESIVLNFPKEVMIKAPGITISQAVVEVKSELTSEHFNLLEDKLKVQRNKIEKPLHSALMISERARKTGNAGAYWIKRENEVIDIPQFLKRKSVDNSVTNLSEKLTGKKISTKEFTYEIEDIAEGQKGSKNWIAVIHADGNNLGKLIQQMAKALPDKSEADIKHAFKEFSRKLDEATVCAAQNAYKEVIVKAENASKKIPIRPVVLGGDDLTVVIRGDLALDFTNVFLKQFEKLTAEKLSDLVKKYGLSQIKNGLTACAGISYVKPSYPFHYAVGLAEELCAFAKKEAKDINPENTSSCLMFHKVQSSFIGSFKDDIVPRELTAGKISFVQGPYFINQLPNRTSVEQLKDWIKTVNREDAPKSGLRNWIRELYHSQESAKQLIERIISLNKDYKKKLNLDTEIRNNKTHIYDVLALSNIQK